jgi:hypothetical protein
MERSRRLRTLLHHSILPLQPSLGTEKVFKVANFGIHYTRT